MTDIFISYSRHDKAFVQHLFDALAAHQREAWIDWEDIPRGEQVLQEIYTGIEGADTFLFVVSEHSLISEVCNNEISHALHHHKRIVPLIRESIEANVEKRIAGEWYDKSWETTARSMTPTPVATPAAEPTRTITPTIPPPEEQGQQFD